MSRATHRSMAPARTLGYVEAHEEAEAERLIMQEMKSLTGGHTDLPKPAGYYLCLKIYVRPEELKTIERKDGTKVTLWLPDTVRTEDKYQSVAALVVAKGPQAYAGKDRFGNPRFPEGPWCRVGDWVLIPRYECNLIVWRGIAMGMLPDDRVLAVLGDPTSVLAVNVADRV